VRNAFARVMTQLAQERSDVCLLSGDIGNRMFDRYKEVAPTRFLNCGIAEANMMSMAAGMALSGLRPVVYTITPFTTTRCLEQIRTGVAYHEAPVVIVGTGSGLSYAELGATHHSLEDLAILRSIPNLQVCAPADPLELEAQLCEAIEKGQPTYIRIGKKGEPNLHSPSSNLGIGKANLLRDGSDLLVIGIGPILSEALAASDLLVKDDLFVAVASLGSIKPLDNTFFLKMTERFSRWVTIEEHSVVGGIGSTLLEWKSSSNIQSLSITRMGVPDTFLHSLGNQNFIRKTLGLDSANLAEAFKREIYL
tara:strand:+ start:1190 stop:2113 length:924 start_codon:yes stop_codon:yes gene_type:complete